ncbi:hypothetical protein [Polluticoccus soli]|uniref:hypothetical protein n=1 Tax=Polluticoccus soli TaxID=3034150 RepID=UPI0023E2D15D|nr:hypothetical protein [Flavipsychrobacter sp. JY13-12]
MKTNPRHEKFIEEMIQHGDRVRAYKAAYPDARSFYASAHRLSNDPEIKARIEEGQRQLEIDNQIRKDEEHLIKMSALSKKRALLSRIINGDMKFEKLVKTADGYEPILVSPTASDVFRAIELDNKLAKEMGMLTEKVKFRITIGDQEFK